MPRCDGYSCGMQGAMTIPIQARVGSCQGWIYFRDGRGVAVLWQELRLLAKPRIGRAQARIHLRE